MLDPKGLPSELPGDPSFSSGDVIELEVGGVSNGWGNRSPGGLAKGKRVSRAWERPCCC